MTVQAGFTDNNYQPSQTTARRPASRKENINMTTIPQNDTHLTFATIDSHVRAQAAMAPSQTKQSALDRLIARYGMIRPILVALEAIPLIPPAWRAGLVAFTTTADEVTLAFQAPVLIPDPANPDFKAGKDQ